ncbi:hypothetical protein IPH92_00290 [Candidatus Kaiserbacteria bacterium]|nr:MAG: hypothetical protein IPH92_00290 [Candidatus Kaiserbacteria bacterium]
MQTGEGKFFASPNAAIIAYDFGVIDLRAKVKVLATDTEKYAQYKGEVFETSVGRLLFNSVLPSDHDYINDVITQRTLFNIIIEIIDVDGIGAVPKIVDRMKRFGFEYATKVWYHMGYRRCGRAKAKESNHRESARRRSKGTRVL